MKHGKVPTRNQKELMLKNNLNPKEWLVVKKMADGFEIVNRENEADRKFLYCYDGYLHKIIDHGYYDIGSSYYGKYLRKLSD